MKLKIENRCMAGLAAGPAVVKSTSAIAGNGRVAQTKKTIRESRFIRQWFKKANVPGNLDVAAAETAALRDLGNTPGERYGGQSAKSCQKCPRIALARICRRAGSAKFEDEDE